MIRFHPRTLLIDLARAADSIGCALTTDNRGYLMVIPTADAMPSAAQRHGNAAVLQIREYRHINRRAVPTEVSL